MTKKGGRIERGIVRFHTYINTTTNYFTANSNANATRLGITDDEVTEWVGFNTTDALYYPTWSNKKIRTTDLTASLHLNSKNCRAFNKTSKLLDRIAASPAAVLMDYEVFNIEHNSPAATGIATQRKTGIEDTVVVSVFYNGGGRVKFQCRPDQSTNKSHIPEGADHLEVRCKLVAPVGGVASTGPDDSQAEWNTLSSKAIVVLDFTPENVGQKAYLFFRWVDSKHPERNGAWTTVLVITIA
jgi:hypothetical protein